MTDINNINKKLEELNNKIKEYEKDIASIESAKESIINNFISSEIGDLDRFYSLVERYNQVTRGDLSYNNIVSKIKYYYEIAFNGIVKGKVNTNTTFRNTDIWLNSKGLARIPYHYYTDRTKCYTNIYQIAKIIKNNQAIRYSIPNKDKRKIFDIFYNFFNSCDIEIEYLNASKRFENLHFEYYYINGDIYSNRNLSLTKLKYDGVEVKILDYSLYFTFFKKDGYKLVSIAIRNDLNYNELHIISQLPSSVYDYIEKVINELENKSTDLLKKVEKLKSDLSPYILHKIF